jgi:hypothetical protein
VFGVFAAGAAVLENHDLFGSVGFVAFGDVVKMPADGALKSHVLPWSFFCHFRK